jgi:flagellar motor switch protein FliG
MAERKLSGYEKAALVIEALGPERAGPVLRHLPEAVLTKLMRAVAVAGQNPRGAEDVRPVVEEFLALLNRNGLGAPGGVAYALQLLESAFGREVAEAWLNRLQAQDKSRPFAAMYQARPEDVATFLQVEHPQTIALVLTYLPAQLSAQVLQQLQPELRVDVARRIGRLDMVPPRVLSAVESAISQRMASWAPDAYRGPKGLEVIVEILNRVDRATERSTLAALGETDPDLAQSIKDRMFMFEDIIQLDDRTLQIVLRRVDKKDLALAIRPLSPEAQGRIFANMGHQAVEEVQAEMNETGPVPLREVEAAQSRIVALVRMMEEAEEIDLNRGGPEDVLI